MIRHEPGVRDSVSEFLRDVGVLMQRLTIDEIRSCWGKATWCSSQPGAPMKAKPVSTSIFIACRMTRSLSTGAFPRWCRPRNNENSNGML